MASTLDLVKHWFYWNFWIFAIYQFIRPQKTIASEPLLLGDLNANDRHFPASSYKKLYNQWETLACQGNLKFKPGKILAYHANQVQVCLLGIPWSLASLAPLGEVSSYFLCGATEAEKCSCTVKQRDASKHERCELQPVGKGLCWRVRRWISIPAGDHKRPRLLMAQTPGFFFCPVLLNTLHRTARAVLFSVYRVCSPIPILKMCQFLGVWNGKLQ